MLMNVKSILGRNVLASDEEAGTVHDCYFDDRFWIVRYWVIDTGNWLPGRKVLITPQAVPEIDNEASTISVSLTKKQIEDSPGIETDLPVSRQNEEALHAYYGWAMYWGNFPGAAARTHATSNIMPMDDAIENIAGDPNLRSVGEVEGYHIAARDGDIGHVEDFILDSNEAALRYLVIDTRNWLPGRKVLIAPHWVNQVDWTGRKLNLNANRSQIERSPEFDPSVPISRENETELHDHFGSPTYWS